jgi:hypothetical protein
VLETANCGFSPTLFSSAGVRLQPELHPSLCLTSPRSLSTLPALTGRCSSAASLTVVRSLRRSARTRCVSQISSCGQCSPIWLMACCISRWTWRCRKRQWVGTIPARVNQRMSSASLGDDRNTHRSRSHHPGQGKPEGVVVVEVLGVVDEQLHVGSEGAPRLLADVLSSLIRVGLGLDR